MFIQSTTEKRHILERKHAESDQRDARAARDVAPGECWAFTNHRTLAEIMAEGLL